MVLVLRRLVSKKKKRYQDRENGFDLDLTYVTDDIIAMGFPSENFERIYRNPMPEVQRFLEMRHKNTYKLYNLCAERHYDKDKFHGRVEESYSFYDHEAPQFKIIIPFCQNVHKWLKEDSGNIAAIHCKAGKGRTGVMICCYMLFSKMYPTANESLGFYANARTHNKKGVTIPSQQRYVRYLERVLMLPENQNVNWDGVFQVPHPKQTMLKLTRIVLSPTPLMKSNLSFQIVNCDFKVMYEYHSDHPNGKAKDNDDSFEFTCNVDVCNDFKIVFVKLRGNKFKRFGQCWMNTCFIDDGKVVFTKPELDKIYKDKKKKFAPNFKVEVFFDTPATTSTAAVEQQQQQSAVTSSGTDSVDFSQQEHQHTASDEHLLF